jgi:group I intron endonuclease
MTPCTSWLFLISPFLFNMIGIYKITSPSGRIYIGQSVDIVKRKQQYSSGINYNNQTKLYNSLVKYGFSEHIFEIVEQCVVEELNERERYWQEFYDVVSQRGLNCRLTTTNDKSGKLSENTIKKISEAKTGVKNGMYGRKHSEEAKAKIRAASLSRTHTSEAKKHMSELKKGVPKSLEHRQALSESKKGIKLAPHTEEAKRKISEAIKLFHKNKKQSLDI